MWNSFFRKTIRQVALCFYSWIWIEFGHALFYWMNLLPIPLSCMHHSNNSSHKLFYVSIEILCKFLLLLPSIEKNSQNFNSSWMVHAYDLCKWVLKIELVNEMVGISVVWVNINTHIPSKYNSGRCKRSLVK